MHRTLQKILLFPFSLLYGFVISIRNRLFDKNILNSTRFDIPVITVGNITVGGTGKTPHIEYIVELLKDDFNIAVLSRGYMRKTRDFNIVNADSEVRTSGDEPLQIKRKYQNITVAVDRNRVNGVKRILAHEPGTNVILLDDAYQHRYIKAGVNILLIDYNRPIIKDYLLPAGSLREPRSSISRADVVLVTKSPDDLQADDMQDFLKKIYLPPDQYAFFTGLSYDEPVNIFTKEKQGAKMDQLAHSLRNVLLVTGIADPSTLLSYLNGYNLNIKHLKYPDHHRYNKKDYRHIIEQYLSLPTRERCLITTEKDAIRLGEIMREEDFPDNNIFYLMINVIFLGDGEIKFNKFILDYVRKNRRNGSLS